MPGWVPQGCAVLGDTALPAGALLSSVSSNEPDLCLQGCLSLLADSGHCCAYLTASAYVRLSKATSITRVLLGSFRSCW